PTTKNSAVLLQINQAGRAIVGWFSRPPSFVSDLAQTVSRAGNDNKLLMPSGVFFGNWDDQSNAGVPIVWWKGKYEKVNSLDPDVAFSEFQADPGNSMLSSGRLQLDPNLGDQPFLMVNVKFDALASRFDRFQRVKLTARVSTLNLQFFAPKLRRMLEAETIAYAPSTYLDQLCARVAPVGTPGAPPSKALLEAYRASSGLANKPDRENVAYTLPGPIGTPEQNAAVGRRLKAQMAAHVLTIGGETKSYLDWYRDVLAAELDDIATNPDASIQATMVEQSIVKRRMTAAGIDVLGDFCYTIKFESTGAEPMIIIKVGVYAFLATIKKDRIAYKRDSAHRIIFDGTGAPSYSVTGNVFDSAQNPAGPKRGYIGAFVDVGIGLGFSLKVLGAGNGLGEMTFLSSQDLNFEEFKDAKFAVAQVAGPTASMGNFITMDSFKSTYVELTLADGRVLATTMTKHFEISPPSLPKPSDLRDPAKYIDKWFAAKLEGKVFDLSEGFGGFALAPAGDITHPVRVQLPDPEAATQAATTRTIDTYFSVNSANINKFDANGISPRYSLEVFLAIDRALFTVADLRLRVWGYASPEYTVPYNLGLSQARAAAVMQAVRDAFGPLLTVQDVVVTGLGEAPAEKNGLHDPETTPDFNTKYAYEKAKWPDWRRVDLEVEGTIIARMSE
ncbi:MAG: hypothetical protein ABI035_10130, partial [Gemmatimonadaceae bacterium]